MGSLDVTWIHGAADCDASPGAPLQVHELDEDTYIIRQNKCSNFEAPFMYLLIGQETALLVDSGAEPERGDWPLSEAIMPILATRSPAGDGTSLQLIVAHSHSHGDHMVGDQQFRGFPRTRLVGPGVAGVRTFFGLSQWPSGTAPLDLGGRRVLVMPLPGHEASHVAFYDERTRVLLTGDTLYPGILTVRDWTAYRRSAARLAEFASQHAVDLVLGAHVEMTRTAGQAYPLGTRFQPDEHVLQLTKADLDEWAAACAAHSRPERIPRDAFIVQPI